MFCIKCSKELPNDAKYCMECGVKIEKNDSDGNQAHSNTEEEKLISHNWLNAGLDLMKCERYEEALAAFEKSLNISPTLIEALENKGEVLKTIGRKKEAQQAIEKADKLKKRSSNL